MSIFSLIKKLVNEGEVDYDVPLTGELALDPIVNYQASHKTSNSTNIQQSTVKTRAPRRTRKENTVNKDVQKFRDEDR